MRVIARAASKGQALGEENIILKLCSKMERVNMAIIAGLFAPYFYFHLLVIHELEGLISFTLFEADFFATFNFTSFQVTPNM